MHCFSHIIIICFSCISLIYHCKHWTFGTHIKWKLSVEKKENLSLHFGFLSFTKELFSLFCPIRPLPLWGNLLNVLLCLILLCKFHLLCIGASTPGSAESVVFLVMLPWRPGLVPRTTFSCSEGRGKQIAYWVFALIVFIMKINLQIY